MEMLSGKCHVCNKIHSFDSKIFIGDGVINNLPEILGNLNLRKPFIIADKNTFKAAGETVEKVLENSGIDISKYVFKEDAPEPDEARVGLAVMNFDAECDAVIGVGSGVINDISKIVAAVAGKPYIIVATAPSMDGFASATSSMTVDGLKISVPSKCADVIVGDIGVLCNAPAKMMLAGLGDMLAKYISICEWRVSNLISGEYYCEEIASLVRRSLCKCVENAEGLLCRDKKAVTAVFEGLILCGAAMKYAGVSRPASGVEHYLSHIWDMRAAEFGAPVEFHGLQCAVGTMIAIKLYDKIKNTVPDREKALDYVQKFNYSDWSNQLKIFLGKGAESMIALEQKEGKYDREKHSVRLERIVEKWNEILEIIEEEIPPISEVEKLYQKLGMPAEMSDIGLDAKLLPTTFKATKDIRDKYVLSRLCWDLGILDEMVE